MQHLMIFKTRQRFRTELLILTMRKGIYLFVCIFILFTMIILLKKSSSSKHRRNYQIDASSSTKRTRCQHITVDQLDHWINSTLSTNQIPKIIHQTWKNQTLRDRQASWSNTWCEQYPTWFYHLWTDEENDRFVRTKFPFFYSTFVQLNPTILKADSVRYLYMFYYGGIYVDLDYESIRSVEDLLINRTVVLSMINYGFNSMNSVPNSWMASKARHPMWTYVIYRIMLLWSRVSDRERNEFWNGKAEFFTGPQSMFEGLMFYLKLTQQTDQSLEKLFIEKDNRTDRSIFNAADITFLGPKLMNAYDWMNGIGSDVCSAEKTTFDEEKCKALVKPIYAITYWSHSYGHGHEKDSNYLQKKRSLI